MNESKKDSDTYLDYLLKQMDKDIEHLTAEEKLAFYDELEKDIAIEVEKLPEE